MKVTKNTSTYKYFGTPVSFAAAEVYVEKGLCESRREYAEAAAIDPEWELEVICQFIDQNLHPALKIDYDLSPPKFPNFG